MCASEVGEMNIKNELFFPPELIGGLKDLRDVEWKKLVERVAVLPHTHPDSLAFALMVIKLSGCLSCGPGSFRHMKGCLSCSRQAISAYKGSDRQLLDLFEESRQEVVKFLDEGKALIAA
jgi:hypothetical protein